MASPTPTQIRDAHASAESKVLARQSALSSPSQSSTKYPLDNIAEGTWTLFSPQLLSRVGASWFESYDAECDEWILEFYDTDFANELYPGSFKPGELLVTLHVGDVHAQFEGVKRPDFAAGPADGEASGIELVQTFKYAGIGEGAGRGSSGRGGKRKVTARLRFLGEGCLTIQVPIGDLLPEKASREGAEKEEVVTLYGIFEEDGEDESDYVPAGEAGDW